jgi:hypothetical protein
MYFCMCFASEKRVGKLKIGSGRAHHTDIKPRDKPSSYPLYTREMLQCKPTPSVILASPPYAQERLPGTMMILSWTSHVFNLKANELPVFGNIIYPLVADYVLLGAENDAYYLVEDTGKRKHLWSSLEDDPVGLQESVIYIVSHVLFGLL